MPSILGKIHNITPSEICAGIISLSATLAQMSRGILLSSIASIDLFIMFSRKIAEYAHIWLILIIEIVTLPTKFSQAPGKFITSRSIIIKRWIIFSRKIAEYAHIWLRLIIEIVTLPANFSQAPGKFITSRSWIIKRWMLPLTDAMIWDQHGTGTCHRYS